MSTQISSIVNVMLLFLSSKLFISLSYFGHNDNFHKFRNKEYSKNQYRFKISSNVTVLFSCIL